MLNRASRARSLVGRTASPSGAASARPFSLPPTIRIARRSWLNGAWFGAAAAWPRGDVARGDVLRGDVARGDVARGEPARGDRAIPGFRRALRLGVGRRFRLRPGVDRRDIAQLL